MSNSLEESENTHMSALIVTGPAGCGKSRWIQEYANRLGRQLFVCPCRKDRTLRDGRQRLHIWGRRTEPAILWLEGADDLTPEAQAFLRRILETHAPQVQFILECRDSSRLQEPIRSRCTVYRKYAPTWDELVASIRDVNGLHIDEMHEYLMSHEYSYRRIQHCVDVQLHMPEMWRHMMEHRRNEREACRTADAGSLVEYMTQGFNPEHLIKSLLAKGDTKLLTEYGDCLEKSGSIWAFAGYALH